MARQRDKSRFQQLNLYAPRIQPSWEELPLEIRKEVACLLAQMSCKHGPLKEEKNRGGKNVDE
jgi:hypothetical protein